MIIAGILPVPGAQRNDSNLPLGHIAADGER